MITNNIIAFSKQFFGAKYESLYKSVLIAVIVFVVVHVSEMQVQIAPLILYLTSIGFTASMMWQILMGKRNMETIQDMLLLPFDHRNFIFSYTLVLSVYVLVTKTLLVWALLFSINQWSILDIFLNIFCGCMACFFATASYLMWKKKYKLQIIFWIVCIMVVIMWIPQPFAIFMVSCGSMLTAIRYLSIANAYEFYHVDKIEKVILQTNHTYSILLYFMRYLIMNKHYLINTIGLCAIACMMPLLLQQFDGFRIFPIGLSILCLNTPICTLISCDPDLEQVIRILPKQKRQFCRKYCLFLFMVNGIVAGLYCCSWQIFCSPVVFSNMVMVFLFSLQSAILSVILEWKYPIHHWKTETDLWHHPRKYFVPLCMLWIVIFLSTYAWTLWIWFVVLWIECFVLLYITRRGFE